MYVARNFVKVTSHQPHREDFMSYLETLAFENPTWASDTGLDDMKWKETINVVKAMCKRYRSGKRQKDFEITVGY